MKIYTKTGDDGTTGLFAGPRVEKDHPRIHAYGTIDELSAVLGVVVATFNERQTEGREESNRGMQTFLESVQCDLFSIGSELATPDAEKHGMQLLTVDRLAEIERQIDESEAALPPLTSFILPGGTLGASMLHLARTVCRRAEREVVGFREESGCDFELIIKYLNRLSDLLFVLARQHNSRCKVDDVPWQRPD